MFGGLSLGNASLLYLGLFSNASEILKSLLDGADEWVDLQVFSRFSVPQ